MEEGEKEAGQCAGSDLESAALDCSESLKEMFHRGFEHYCRHYRDLEHDGDLYTSSNSSSSPDAVSSPSADDLIKLRQLFHRVAFFVERLALFSPNEELEDIPSGHLQFLLIPFILAELSSHCLNPMPERLKSLQSAMIYWQNFLVSLDRLGLAESSKLAKRLLKSGGDKSDTQSVDAMTRRTEKIESYRRQQEYRILIGNFMKAQSRQQSMTKAGREGEDEDTNRELSLTLLKRSVEEAADHMCSAKQEIELLEHAQARGAAGKMRAVSNRESEAEHPRRPPFLYQINDAFQLRNLYRDRVFKPFLELPSISLAEVAGWEMEVEVGELGAVERAEQKVKEERKKKEEAGEEVESDEADSDDGDDDIDKVKEKRDWDNWKDDNPKGWGNKNRNIG